MTALPVTRPSHERLGEEVGQVGRQLRRVLCVRQAQGSADHHERQHGHHQDARQKVGRNNDRPQRQGHKVARRVGNVPPIVHAAILAANRPQIKVPKE